MSPYDAVTGLVRHAMKVADGVLPDPIAFREQLAEAEELITEYADDAESGAVLIGVRLTPLDPRRPARDLLEDLLTGINGCWLLHDEYAEPDDEGDEGDEPDGEDESDDETAERHQRRSRARFAALVRAVAAQNRDRLT